MTYQLKPFVIDQTDIQFILDQLDFLPLFDAAGNALINWDGTGVAYDRNHTLVWNPAWADGTHFYKGTALTAANHLDVLGISYSSVIDLAGLRDVSGLNNNLSLINNAWGSVDQLFTRSAAADYAHYSPVMQGVATAAYYAAKQYYTAYATGGGSFNASKTDYTITNIFDGTHHATDGTPITIKNVVDYTPRMISLTTTTAGVTYDTWANHAGEIVIDPTTFQPNHHANEIYYGADGVAKVLSWGQLETVANGGLGQVDTQARLAGSAGQNDHFIGALNPGVSPSNGFFALFGQFFDHGLDFIDKSSGATIKIALAADDPLYGMLGPDGQPVHEITITRATVQTVDAKGAEYTNHTSPFIDQSQTYGSHEQLTSLLREWVNDPATGNFHAGMKLFDGSTLDTSWTRADGTVTNDTLPTLNELAAAVVATGRDALTWEDVLNLRNRDASGHVITGAGAGESGSALLLDMNPRFDGAHLYASTGFNDANHNGSQDSGETGYVGFVDTNHNGVKDGAELTQVQVVDAAISTLHNYVASAAYTTATGRSGDSFNMDAATGKLTLVLATPLAAGPGTVPAGTYTGASAMMLWVNFGNMSIISPPAIHSAVSDILMASVGDHYIAGDGRVNENFGLTSIHHVFHEEHNFQVQNLIDALHKQDIATNDLTHAKLHEFQVNTNHGTNAAGDYLDANGNISWDQDKVFNGAKLIVEMEYQHAAVDQYARNVSPNIQEFGAYSTGVNSAISLEYAQSVFRFGHSTLRETIDTIDPDHGLTGKIMGYALKEAFLSPEKFADVGAAGILLGMSHQQMNEVDEFVTPALNQGLLGQPLDLAAINIARGRDLGIPTLNDFRAAVGLVKYTSWNDFGQNMQHPSSLANFIAAYAFDGNVDKASAIIGLADGTVLSTVAQDAATAMGWDATFALNFLNGADTTFNLIDTWIGGLAEIHQPGGLLGETFDKVFVDQIEQLMDGDRFYYLYRLAGQQFGEEVGNAQLKDIVERNTGLTHLNGNIFGYADQYVDLGAHRDASALVANGGMATDLTDTQAFDATTGTLLVNSGNTVSNEHKYGDIAAVDAGTIGVYSNGGHGNLNDGMTVTIGGVQYILDTRLADTHANSAYTQNGGVNLDGTPNSGAESNEDIIGTKGADLIYAQGGDDTVYGDGGNDIIFGGYGIDRLYGGDGADEIHGGDNPDLIDGGSGDDMLYGDSSGSDINGQDQIIGGSGNDVLYGGVGIDKLSAGSGDDQIYGGQDTDPATHGGDGNDVVDGGSGTDVLYGDNGDDLIRDGTDVDISFGGRGDDIMQVGDIAQALGTGPDEVLGGDGTTDEGNVAGTIGFDFVDFSLQTKRNVGIDFTLGVQNNPLVAVNSQQIIPASFQLEGAVGSQNDDKLEGSNAGDASLTGALAQYDLGENWLIGGSGNDTLSGLGGNDVIVGGSIRLDALIGKYMAVQYDANGMAVLAGGNPILTGAAATYDHNNNNTGSTDQAQLLDALYQGASHRAGYADVLSGGLLAGSDVTMNLHFTEMLRSDQFKNLILGDGGPNGGVDTALYTGNRRDYTVTALDASGHVLNDPYGVDAANVFGVKIHDNRGPNAVDAAGNPIVNDGTDVVVGVQNFKFADKTVDVTNIFNHKPTGSIGFSVQENANNVVLSGTSQILDLNNVAPNNALGAVTTGITYRWYDVNNAPINANSATLTQSTTGGRIVHLEATYTDAIGTVEKVVSPAWNLVVGTSGNNTGASALNGTASTTVGDAIFGLGGNDTLNGLAGDDRLYGGAGTDVLNGGDGNDYLDGGTGSDTLTGGDGDDTYVIANNTNGNGPITVDAIVENAGAGAGIDTVLSSVTYTLGVNVENLTLTGGGGNNATGNGLDNVLTGNSGANRLDGLGGSDTAVFGGSVVQATAGLDNSGSVTVRTGNGASTDTLLNIEKVQFGADTYNLVAGTNGADASLAGGAGADLIVGGRGNDIVTAGAGDDVIVWTATGTNNGNAVLDGRDFVDGGANASATSVGDTMVVNGNNQSETFNIYTKADWLAIAGNTAAQLNAATEIVIARNGLNNAAVISELSNVEEIRINTGGGNDTVNVSGNFNATHLNTSTITISGSGGNDTVDITTLLSAHRIVFQSNGGTDQVLGTLRPQDVIELPPGMTLADYVTTTDVHGVTTMTSLTSTITYSSGASGHPQVETSDVEQGSDGGTNPPPAGDDGSQAQVILGTRHADWLDGGAGSDIIIAKSGNDTFIGHAGDGNDVYRGDGGRDTYDASAAAYDLTINLSSGHASGGDMGNDVLRSVENATGGAGDDTIIGTGEANILRGEAGNDRIFGLAGNDSIFGGAGDDILNGGAGNDRFNGGEGNDKIYVGQGNDTILLNSNFGNDFIVGFDANAAGGQDHINIAALGITSAHFNDSVKITHDGADTLVTIGTDGTLRLVGVDWHTVNQADFHTA